MNTELIAKNRCESVSDAYSGKALYAKVEGDENQIRRGIAKLVKKLKSEIVYYSIHLPAHPSSGIHTVNFKSKLRPEKLRDVANTILFSNTAGILYLFPDLHQIKIISEPVYIDDFLKVVAGLSKSLGVSVEFQPGNIFWIYKDQAEEILSQRESKGSWVTAEIFVPRMPELG